MAKHKVTGPLVREQKEGEYDAEIARVFAPGSMLYDMAIEGALEENYGQTEFERGVVEGGRRMMLRFINTATEYRTIKEK
jgi:hypothetical protein